jgi:hypothetical protein
MNRLSKNEQQPQRANGWTSMMRTGGAIDRISDLMSNFVRDANGDPLLRLRTRVGRIEQ